MFVHDTRYLSQSFKLTLNVSVVFQTFKKQFYASAYDFHVSSCVLHGVYNSRPSPAFEPWPSSIVVIRNSISKSFRLYHKLSHLLYEQDM